MSTLLKKSKALLPKGRFAKSVAVLAGGTALGQGIGILASPILTRLYTPEDFGVLAIYAAILGIVVVVASLRYQIAIPLPEDDETGVNLLILSLGIVVFMSGLASVLVYVLRDRIILWTNAPLLRPYLWLVPMGLLAVGIYQVLNFWAIRKKAFPRIARTKFNQGVGMALTQIILGLNNIGPLGLIVGHVVGQTAGSVTLALVARREDGQGLKDSTPVGVFRAAIRYRRFPVLSSGSALFNSMGMQLPVLLLVAFYGPLVGGWFALVQRVIGVPMGLIGRSVAQVYFGEASRLRYEPSQAMRRLFFKTARKLFLIGILPVALLGFGGPWLFAWVFGAEWRQAGGYMQLLAAMMLAQFIVVPLSQTLNILERQDLQLLWDAGRLVSVVSALVGAHILGWSHGTAIGVYGVAMLMSYAALFGLLQYGLGDVVREH